VLSQAKDHYNKLKDFKSPNEVQRTILAKAQINISKFVKLPGNPYEGASLRESKLAA
jgi:hypothetical protein